MISLVTSSGSAALTVAQPAAATPVDQRRNTVAVEPVARAEFIGRRFSHRRSALFIPGQDDGTHRLRAVAGRGDDTPYRPADGEAAAFPRPSAAYLAQYFGQELEAEGARERSDERAGVRAYSAAAERDTTFFGFAAPVDFVV